jgi:hypothetical protein
MEVWARKKKGTAGEFKPDLKQSVATFKDQDGREFRSEFQVVYGSSSSSSCWALYR